MACLSAAYARKGLLARAHSQRRRRMPLGKGGDSTNETDLGYFWDEKKSRNADSGARYRDGFAL